MDIAISLAKHCMRTCRRLTCFFILVSGALSASDLHLFLVGDYDSNELMPALRNDITNMRNEARTIAKYTGLKISETILTGPSARTPQVLSKLQNLKVTPDDVIFFYFTGHGFRTVSKGNDPWPNLFFATEYEAIDFTHIIDILAKKSARLQLLIVDCCNNIIADNAIPIAKEIFHGANMSKLIQDNYRKLFLKTTGTIAMAACKAGQTSLALGNGSLYTLAFLDTLHQETKKPTDQLDWQSLLDLTNHTSELRAQQIGEEQNPIFLIM